MSSYSEPVTEPSWSGSPPLPPDRAEPAIRKLLAVMIGVGLGLRLAWFLSNNSLGMDEVRIAINVLSRPYTDLLPPLEHDQSAPLLFLWSLKALTDLFGPGELALRATALACGIGILFLAYPALRRTVGDRGAVIATGLLALSPGLIEYSATVKQYGVEALVTLVLIKLALDTFQGAGAARARWLLLAGALAPWASPPAVFVLASIIAALGLASLKGGNPSRRLVGYATALWGSSSLLAYAAVYRHASDAIYMQRFWGPAFLTPGNSEAVSQFLRVARGMLWGGLREEYSLGFGDPVRDVLLQLATIGLVVFAFLGVRRLYRSQGLWAVILLTGPILLALGASVIGVYPFSRRLLLFAVPLVAALVAAGISLLSSRAGMVLAGLVVFPMVIPAVQVVRTEFPANRTVIETFQRTRAAGEPIYLSPSGIPAWTYYTTDWEQPDTARLGFLNRASAPGGPSFENAPSRGRVPMGAGDELVWSSPAGDEILGLATGIELRAGRGYAGAPVDGGWPENESARIRSVASPGVWVLLEVAYGPEAELLDALGRLGARETFRLGRRGLLLARFDFP